MRLRAVSSFASVTALAASLASVAAADDRHDSLISGPFKAVGLIGCEERANSELTSEVIEDGTALRTLSFKAVSGFHALGTSAAGLGRAVGVLNVATRAADNNPLRYKLVTPKRAAKGPVRLLSSGGLRVVYRPGRRVFLSIYGLPPDTQYVYVSTRRNTLLRRTSDRVVLDMTGYLTGRPSETISADDQCGLAQP